MTRKEVLDAATAVVCGDRDKAYGRPEDTFTRIANLWSAYLAETVTPVDVANMMILLKIARAQNGVQHDDNYVDIAGYAACAAVLDVEG